VSTGRRGMGGRTSSGMWWPRCGVMLLALSSLAGCGPPARPDGARWGAEWARARALVPSADESERDVAQKACEILLVGARRARETLLPTPSRVLDDPIRDWIEQAESLGFTCPAANGHAEANREAITSLHVLEAEIEAALQSATPP
jgi:hypothetical protein